MTYNEVIEKLESVDTDELFPIFVPSALRPAHYTYQNLISQLSSKAKSKVYYCVRENEYAAYKKAQPDVNFIVIPKELIHEDFGTDSTRKFMYEKALELGYNKIIDVDDDIQHLTMVYSDSDMSTSRRLRKEVRTKYIEQILSLGCAVSNEFFKSHKHAVIGSFMRITPSTCKKEQSELKAVSYMMGIPRQFMFINLKRAAKLEAFRTGLYDLQAEDIAYDAIILEHGGSLFRMPSFVYDVPDEVTNPRTEVILHANRGNEKFLCTETTKMLQKTVIGDCLLCTAKFEDNTPRYFTINWRKYNAKFGTQPIAERW